MDLVKDRIMADIVRVFGVPEENDNERRVINLCAERGLRVGNTYLNICG